MSHVRSTPKYGEGEDKGRLRLKVDHAMSMVSKRCSLYIVVDFVQVERLADIDIVNVHLGVPGPS